MTEVDALWVAAVFAAETEFEIAVRAFALFDGDANELADAVLVEVGERVRGEDAALDVVR